jgi:hypothetical protein
MEGAHFCARSSAFKTLSLFFCNSTALSPGLDRTHPEISRSPEIFGEDCEIQVTLHRLWEIYGFADIWMYILENKITICLQDVVINTALNDHRSHRSTRAASAPPDVAIHPYNILILLRLLR